MTEPKRRFQVHYGTRRHPRNSYLVVDTTDPSDAVLMVTQTKGEAVAYADRLNENVKSSNKKFDSV